jgi:hypothetical protein
MDLLSRTFERTNYSYHIGDNGEQIYTFKMTSVKIDDSTTYHIHRASRPNESHTIERSKKSWDVFRDIRYKIYSDDKSFENAIKRIEKMAQKSQG